MPEIRDIGINNLDVGEIQIRDLNVREIFLGSPTHAVPIYPPVTSVIGSPIVDVPGCVESHRDSKENQSLIENDDDGVIVLCDAGVPATCSRHPLHGREQISQYYHSQDPEHTSDESWSF